MSSADSSAPALCPLCGENNACAVQAGLDPRSCWCMTAGGFPPGLLELVPPERRRKACICRTCLERYKASHPE